MVNFEFYFEIFPKEVFLLNGLRYFERFSLFKVMSLLELRGLYLFLFNYEKVLGDLKVPKYLLGRKLFYLLDYFL